MIAYAVLSRVLLSETTCIWNSVNKPSFSCVVVGGLLHSLGSVSYVKDLISSSYAHLGCWALEDMLLSWHDFGPCSSVLPRHQVNGTFLKAISMQWWLAIVLPVHRNAHKLHNPSQESLPAYVLSLAQTTPWHLGEFVAFRRHQNPIPDCLTHSVVLVPQTCTTKLLSHWHT